MVKLSTTGLVALISITIYAVILTGLEILVIYFHHDFVSQFELSPQGNGISSADLIYHTIFILSLAFQVLLCVDALWRKNSMQLMALVVFNLLSLVYAGVQLFQHIILENEGTSNATFKNLDPIQFPDDNYTKDYFIGRMRPVEFVIICLVSVFSAYLAILSYKLTKEFGWDIYRTYNADVEVRNAFRSLSIIQTLIKLDIFFIGSYAIQLIPSQSIGYKNGIIETILIFVVGTLMLLLAWYSVIKESKYVLLSVINLLTLSLIYMVYRLISINLPFKSVGDTAQPPLDPYEFTRRLLTFFLVTTFVLVLATIFYALRCFRNMMHGVYIFSVFGLPGQEQEQKLEIQQNSFNTEYLGYDGLTVPENSKQTKQSKRASKIAEVAQNRLSRRLSID